MTDDEVMEQKFYVRKVRAKKGYINEWQVAFPGSLDEETKAIRVPTWEAAMFVTIHGVDYIARHGWEQFKERVLHVD